MGAVLLATRDGDVELPRKVRVGLITHEHLSKLTSHRGGVEKLVRRKARHGTAHHITDIVHSCLQRDQPNCLKPFPDLRDMFDRKPAQLDLLASSDIGKAFTEIFTYLADGPNLGCVADPIRNANAHHEMARSLPPKKYPGPFESFLVALADRFPSFLDIAGNIPKDVQAVFFFLVLLDLIHGCVLKNKRRSTVSQ